ncbi:eCIS core domain-containing protein [Paractinoplanes globisporus]|uniref:DUF4157 domain-containing protein n=1 Tax=Paractinoplanes globisporus TaxID=113565 RepID=A0ABW6WM43_9ACTN|nr:DUF4157 domain-containing protein [Actinoplanes globisporus]
MTSRWVGAHRLQRSVSPTAEAEQREQYQAPVGNAAVMRLLRAGQGAGSPLPTGVREQMEAGFGADFSAVRVHTGARAEQLNRVANAEAVTSGTDIHLAGPSPSRELLAHELTHVVQQSTGTAGPTGTVSRESDASEVEANRVAATLGAAGGNQAVQRLLGGTRGQAVQLSALPAPDTKAIAEQVHEAMAGWGTDEEAIFVALQHLNRDAAAVTALTAEYRRTYGNDLEADLRDEMSGSELDLALELIRAGSDAKVGPGKPADAAGFDAAAKRLHAAMAGWGTDEEAVYATLIPFDRDPAALTTLKTTYKTLYGVELADDIADDFSSDELRYALFLLNAPPKAVPRAGTTLNAPGTEALTFAVPGGVVSVHTGAEFTAKDHVTDGFTLKYEGGLANESHWLQFIWREIVAQHPVLGEIHVDDSITTSSRRPYKLTTDPDDPQYNTDSKDPKNPYYEAGFASIRTDDSTTMLDHPAPVMAKVRAQFAAGATSVVSRAHFTTFLIRDYRTVAFVALDVEWTFASPVEPPRVQSVKDGGKADALPKAIRETLIQQYPDFAYIW